MTPQERREFDALKAQVRELTEWKNQKERQQLKAPLDIQSISVLEEALRDARLDRINVRDIFFSATQDYPAEYGQMRFFNDGVSQNVRINLGTYEGRVVLANP